MFANAVSNAVEGLTPEFLESLLRNPGFSVPLADGNFDAVIAKLTFGKKEDTIRGGERKVMTTLFEIPTPHGTATREYVATVSFHESSRMFAMLNNMGVLPANPYNIPNLEAFFASLIGKRATVSIVNTLPNEAGKSYSNIDAVHAPKVAPASSTQPATQPATQVSDDIWADED